MMLSLALVLFLVAALGADAAPQAKPKETEADKLSQMVTISGECTKLVHAGQPIGGCKSILVNMNYNSTGVSGYWFMTQNTILSFAGDGSRRIEQGSDGVIQAIERIFLADMVNERSANDAKEDPAVGFCRFGDPTKRGTTVECVAYTQAGLYEGTFVTDGKPPMLKEFQVSR
jgi:hypothetical protein